MIGVYEIETQCSGFPDPIDDDDEAKRKGLVSNKAKNEHFNEVKITLDKDCPPVTSN